MKRVTTWRDYFTAPYYIDMRGFVYDDNANAMLQTDDIKLARAIVAALNGYDANYDGAKCNGATYCAATQEVLDYSGRLIADIRGYAYLKQVCPDKAEYIQDEMGEYMAKLMNNLLHC